MKKRILSLILALCLAVALAPTSALATTAIVYTVNITMSKVEVGKPLPTDAKTPSTANSEVTEIEWKGDLDANGNAIAGKEYTVHIIVRIKEGKDAKFGPSVNAKVNDSSTGVSAIQLGTAKARVTYKCTAGQAETKPALPNILSIKLTMTQPEVGKPLPTNAKTSSTADCEVTNVAWSGQLDASGNMAYETVYTAVFTVETKKGLNVKFSTAKETEFVKNASLNGEYKGFTKAEKVSDTMVKLTYELAAVKKPSTTISKLDNIHLIVPSLGYAPDKSGYTDNSAKVKVTETKWSGEVDNYGLAIAGVSYVYTFTVEIKPEYDLTFATGTLKATINSKSDGVKVERLSDKKAIVTCTFPALKEKEKPTVDKSKTYTQAEADAHCPKLNPITIVVSEDNQDMDFINNEMDLFVTGDQVFGFLTTDYHTLEGDVINSKDSPWIGHSFYGQHADYFGIDRIVYDLYRWDDYSVIKYYTAKELWLSPKCDIQGILDGIGRVESFPGSFNTYDYTIFIPDSVYPNGPTYHTALPPGCRVMLYSGSDVYAAAKKGKEAAREWCFNHSYTAEIQMRDRVYRWDTCQNHRLYYYSCSKCGKCEYNPKHYWVYTDAAHANMGVIFTEFDGKYSAHQYETHTVSDEHFLGLNAQGDRVYLRACVYCGKDQRQTDLATTHDYYKNVMGMDDSDPSYYQLYMEKVKKSWAPGGGAYNMRMKATPEKDYLDGYVVEADKFVTAKTSGWATQSVQVASNDDLIDKALLGSDYTKTITRLQFCSVAVKMAEKMLDKELAPAPAGTFSDTDNLYVRKASAAGLVSGSNGKFDPNGTLDRQQMATLIYNVLMYVKANSDTEYTVYDSVMAGFSDSKDVASWAKKGMDFMTGLKLMSGSGGKLSPKNPCSIQEALILADKSLDAGVIGWYQYNTGDHDTPADFAAPGYGFVNYGDRVWFTSADGKCKDTHGIECHVVVKNNDWYPIKDR